MERRKVGATHRDVKLVERGGVPERLGGVRAQLVEVVEISAQRVRRRALLRRQVLAERRERLVHGGAIVAQRAASRESSPVNG